VIARVTLVAVLTVVSWSLLTADQSPAAPTTPTFTRWSTFCEGVEHTASVALGDLDGDGDLDVLFGNGRHFVETNWILSNDGYGMFYGRRAFGGQPNPTYGVALGDLDGDGALDAVVANDLGHPSVLYRNDGKGNLVSVLSLGTYPDSMTRARRAVALGDLDGDGDLDVVLVGLDQDHLYLNEDGGRRWVERAFGSRETGDAPRWTGVALADVDGDADLDIVVPGRYESRSLIYLNDGKASFAEHRPFGATADDPTSVAVGDMDGDGDLDIVAAHWEQPHLLYVNDGGGNFTPHGRFGSGREQAWSVALADMDLDGDLDAVVGSANIDYWNTDVAGDKRPDQFGNARRDEPSRLFFNDGTGRMTAGPTLGTGIDNTRPLALGDVDGDGDTDIVMGNDCQPNHVFFNSLRSSQRSR
jgi:hypothetical protein